MMMDIVKIKSNLDNFIYKRLPLFYDTEGFICLIMFRRKWLIKQFPEKELEFRNLFRSDEMCIEKFVLSGNIFKFSNKIITKLSVLTEDFAKEKVFKGVKYNVALLYKEYKNAFSILITYEPRDLFKAARMMVIEYVRKLISGDFTERDIQHLDYEWYKFVHKSKRKNGNKKFVLVDIDYNSRFESKENFCYNDILNRFIKLLQSFLLNLDIIDNLKYACTTPSKGMHLLFEIDEKVGKNIFKERCNFVSNIKSFGEQVKFGIEEVEIKTGQCLTHIPAGINDYVRDMTNYLKV